MAIGDIIERTVTRKDGSIYTIYQGEYRDRDGKRRFVSHKLKKEAQRLLRESMNEVEAGTHAKGATTLGQAIDEYLYDCEKSARRGDITRGFARSEQCGAKMLPETLTRMRLSEFKDTGQIKEVLEAFRDQGYAVRTVLRVRGTLSRVFEFAVSAPRGYIPRNIMRDYPVRLPKPPKRKNKADVTDAAHLLRVACERPGRVELLSSVNLYGILCFIAQTGARPEEACGLQITDIKRFERPPPDRPNVWADVLIQNTNTRDDGFRNRTKTDKVRAVPVGRLFLDAVDRVDRYWQAVQAATSSGYRSYQASAVAHRVRHYFETSEAPLERRQHGFVFVSKTGLPYHSHSLAPLVRDLVRSAGLVERDSEGRIVIGENGKPKAKYTLYSFRHMVATFNATRLPTHIGAAVTGHNSDTYLKTYVHQSAGDQLLIAQSLSDLEDELTATNVQQRLLTG